MLQCLVTFHLQCTFLVGQRQEACFLHAIVRSLLPLWCISSHNVSMFLRGWLLSELFNILNLQDVRTCVQCVANSVVLFCFQVSDYPGGVAVVYGGFSRLVSVYCKCMCMYTLHETAVFKLHINQGSGCLMILECYTTVLKWSNDFGWTSRTCLLQCSTCT